MPGFLPPKTSSAVEDSPAVEDAPRPAEASAKDTARRGATNQPNPISWVNHGTHFAPPDESNDEFLEYRRRYREQVWERRFREAGKEVPASIASACARIDHLKTVIDCVEHDKAALHQDNNTLIDENHHVRYLLKEALRQRDTKIEHTDILEQELEALHRENNRLRSELNQAIAQRDHARTDRDTARAAADSQKMSP